MSSSLSPVLLHFIPKPPYMEKLPYRIQIQWDRNKAELISSSRGGAEDALPGFCSLLPTTHAHSAASPTTGFLQSFPLSPLPKEVVYPVFSYQMWRHGDNCIKE